MWMIWLLSAYIKRTDVDFGAHLGDKVEPDLPTFISWVVNSLVKWFYPITGL